MDKTIFKDPARWFGFDVKQLNVPLSLQKIRLIIILSKDRAWCFDFGVKQFTVSLSLHNTVIFKNTSIIIKQSFFKKSKNLKNSSTTIQLKL